MPNRPDRARLVLPRLYAILDTDAAAARGLPPHDLAAAWIDAGVRLVQIRAKSLTLGPFAALAREMTARARPAGGMVVVNDRADVAVMSDADGVHVGQDDLSPAEIRALIGGGPVVGFSTHTTAQVAAAASEPIDYVAIGPVFETSTKTSAWATVGIDGVRAAVAASGGLPVVAIGGITIANAPAVIAAGAASVAVISDLLVGSPAARSRDYLRALA